MSSQYSPSFGFTTRLRNILITASIQIHADASYRGETTPLDVTETNLIITRERQCFYLLIRSGSDCDR